MAALSARLEHLRAELERLTRRGGSGVLSLASANASSVANPHHAAPGPHAAQSAPAGGLGQFSNHHNGYGVGERDKENVRLTSGGGRLNPEKEKNL